MRALLLFVLAGFGCSLAKGRTVSKCELRNQLKQAVALLSQGAKQAGLTEENFMAKIVCHAELASQFNTSAVSELMCRTGGGSRREKRAIPYLHLLTAASEEGRLSAVQSGSQEEDGPGLRYDCEGDDETWMLFGLFQLGSHLTCSDGVTPSPNICGMDCVDLLDDNIHDDIRCVLTVFRNLVENGFRAAHWKGLRGTVRLILQEGCWDKQASEYFAEC